MHVEIQMYKSVCVCVDPGYTMKRCEFRGGADAHRGGARVGGRSGVRRCQHATMHHVGHDGGCGGCRRGLGRRGAGRGGGAPVRTARRQRMVVHAAAIAPRRWLRLIVR